MLQPSGNGIALGWRRIFVLVIALFLVSAVRAAALTGDCDGNGCVSIDEVLTAVNVALSTVPISECGAGDANGDGQITIDEILAAVNNSLNNGCQPTPTGTRTVSPTPIQTPTPTPVEPLAVIGTCKEPSGMAGLGNCDAGTRVTISRCDDVVTCLTNPAARTTLLAADLAHPNPGQVDQGGAFDIVVNKRDIQGRVLHLEAAVAGGVIYRTLRAGPAGTGESDAGTRGARAAGPQLLADTAGVEMFDIGVIDPSSEAAVRLLDENGLENFSGDGIQAVTSAVRDANSQTSFAGLSPAQAANVATDTAQQSTTVNQTIQMSKFTPTPTATSTPTNPPTNTPTPTACVVGAGTVASCTDNESALDACLPGGARFNGTVTFSCGGTATITVTHTTNISADTTIDGGSLVTISGGNTVRVFSVNSGVGLTVKNLTIADGHVMGANGGGILNNGRLTVTNSAFSSNSASHGSNGGGDGGGILNNVNGTLRVTNSTFSGNSADYDGGGAIYNVSRNTLTTVTNSTFSSNSGPIGGAIFNDIGTLLVSNSTFYSNSANNGGYGGGISNFGTLTVTTSTFSGNSATSGGAVFNENGTLPAWVANSTFSGNSADVGGAINNFGVGSPGTELEFAL